MPLARHALHDSGEDIHVAVWPTAHEMLQVASRHYAFEGRCFVMAAGSIMRGRDLPASLEPHVSKVPAPDALVMRGGSAIYGPHGAVIAGPVYDEVAIVFGDLDIGRVREESMTLDVAGHYARPDCFRFEVK
jgi:predicted amidohydrolase